MSRVGGACGAAASRVIIAVTIVTSSFGLVQLSSPAWYFVKPFGLDAMTPALRDSLIALPAISAIIDAEIVVCDCDGKPDFEALMDGTPGSVRPLRPLREGFPHETQRIGSYLFT